MDSQLERTVQSGGRETIVNFLAIGTTQTRLTTQGGETHLCTLWLIITMPVKAFHTLLLLSITQSVLPPLLDLSLFRELDVPP